MKERVKQELEDGEEHDNLSITGLEYVRSDTAPIIQDSQWKFAETLRMDQSEAREYLFPYLREQAEAVQSGNVELDYVCKRGGIGQDLSEYGTANRRASTFYRGCKYANQNIDGVTIQQGDKSRLVHIKDVQGDYPSVYDTHTAEDGDPVDAVTVPDPSQLPDEFVVDWDSHWVYYREAMKPLLETRFGGEAWNQCLHNHSQTNLNSF